MKVAFYGTHALESTPRFLADAVTTYIHIGAGHMMLISIRRCIRLHRHAGLRLREVPSHNARRAG